MAALPVVQMGKKRTQTGAPKAVDAGDAELLLQQAAPTEQDDGQASPSSDLTADHADVGSEVDIEEDSEGGGSDDGFGPESAEEKDEETEDSDEVAKLSVLHCKAKQACMRDSADLTGVDRASSSSCTCARKVCCLPCHINGDALVQATDEEVDAAIVDYAQEAAARSAPGETSGREQPTPAASR